MITYNQLSLADIFQVAKIFMNLTNLLFCHCLNPILTLMKLSRLPSGSVSMLQQAETANTLCLPSYGI